jgi:His/Glu/Gln/Arg/opine family amino acid ABC transporter permease subunit
MDVILDNAGQILQGAGYTLGTAGYSVLFSLILGSLLGIASAARIPILHQALTAYTELIRNTPELVQLFWIYLVLPAIGIRLTILGAVIVYLCVNGVAYTLLVVRGGIEAVPVGQFEASRALGLGRYRTYRRIILPQALRSVAPSLVNEVIRILKNSTLVSLVAAPDLIYQVTHLANINFEPIVFQLLAAAFFFVVITLISILARGVTNVERIPV